MYVDPKNYFFSLKQSRYWFIFHKYVIPVSPFMPLHLFIIRNENLPSSFINNCSLMLSVFLSHKVVSKCHGFYDIAFNPSESHSIFVVLYKYDRSSLSTMTRCLLHSVHTLTGANSFRLQKNQIN